MQYDELSPALALIGFLLVVLISILVMIYQRLGDILKKLKKEEEKK